MNEQAITHAALSDHRFNTPLNHGDEFRDIPMREAKPGEVSLVGLRLQADESATKEARRAIERNPGCPKNQEDHDALLAKRIFDVLTCKRYRRGPQKFVEGQDQEAIIAQITDRIRLRQPVELILSFFGSKVQNQLKTFAEDGTEVDLSEVASLLRFYEIARSVEVVYDFGAEVKIACDGRKYADSIGFSAEAGSGYFKNICLLAEYMGLGDHVKLFDEAEHYPDDITERMESRLVQLRCRYEQGDLDLIRFVEKLRLSLAISIPQNGVALQQLSLAFSSQIPCSQLSQICRESYDLRQGLVDRSRNGALRYIAMYDVVKDAGIIESVAPNAIRATVHPKQGQIGLYAVNSAVNNRFPHHVQGVMSDFNSGGKLDDVRGSFAADLRRADQNLVGITLPTAQYPFSNGKHPFAFLVN